MKITTKLICMMISWLCLISQSEGNTVYEEAMSRFSAEPSQENFMQLAGHLRGIARYRERYKENEYFLRIQHILLSTPGHARYFADEIEREREKEAHLPRINRLSHDRVRSIYFTGLFIHLPSPEMIFVLGEMLEDDRDPPIRLLNPPDNANYAAYTLSRIGLRDTPFGEVSYPMQLSIFHEADILDKEILGEQPHLADFKNWWKQVRSGERSFSFKGQDVEYRFKPDGTWETIPIANPPNDGPRPLEPEPAAPVERETPSQPVAPVEQDEPSPWRWIWIPIAVVLIAGFFGLRLFRKKES